MQHLIIDKIFTESWITGLFMITATFVAAVVLPQNVFASQLSHQYSIHLIADQTNPWALPQTSEEFLDPQQRARFRGQSRSQAKSPSKQPDIYRFNSGQMGRFVTPEYLESLKQQQMQMQMVPHMMPGGRQYNQQMRRRSPSTQATPQKTRPQQAWPLLPSQGAYGAPTYDMGNVNPLYYDMHDVPSVSPWSSGSDLIYRGGSVPDSLPGDFSGSLPWVPNEALGGLPPIHTPNVYPFMDGGNNSEGRVEDNVFNPFTFLPNR
ncbi:hypothetical protein JYT79_02145 [Cardiobacterium sp. AH-315-I02]|nr:hypothetical protein [Cardiobacterium sp. AH-315-I02]